MSAQPAFAPWQARIHDQVRSALDSGRLGHALLFCGPARLGKRAVADALAAHVLGLDREVRSAQLLAAGTHPDFHSVSFVPTKDGTKLRTEIVIDQIRELSAKLSLTPQYGSAQVAIVDPADAVNTSACNALLKTLEEPQPGRHLWLVAANPLRLPATIRSRCQRIEFRLPPHEEALAWLAGRGHREVDAIEALDAARGHPGLAAEWLDGGGMALRREVAKDLAGVAKGDLPVVATAQRWASGDDASERVAHAADLALARASGLTDVTGIGKLAAWFDAANRTRDLLRTTVRADLAIAELLLAWRGTVARN
ncbi:DNA polymerase III subunit delta' [Luteimonas fraxinea]|uniref:DNA-directed DNA polymerase n=1 Tax=Luteimonas fraxinea TaxID=2901869 RepID=A0ABS8UA17_9GAMM|nr:DNA polymerase III subunit delta' [Luteimonas fraxinea]MCD9096321.1 DNA polymerase III subunit delta' [Luteimonas fraxinea]MCD9125664.1 DNA polymerase III subunit delta' [Luteimonas fraxinea]UHH10301.1 DNA polymerase III subunit delta' [Luteimonas fraxinea]